MRCCLSLQQTADKLKCGLESQKNTMLLCAASVLFWGLLAHAYGFFHCSLSHDVLNAFAASPTEEAWKIELGRFFVPVYRAVFRGPVTLPWLIGLLGLLWTAAAVYMVTRLFDIRSRLPVFIIAGLMVTNITYISQIATYIYEFDFNAFSLMLAVASVYCWKKGGSSVRCLSGIVCLLFSIGIYQAYFSVALTLIIALSIKELFDRAKTRDVIRHGLWGVLMLLLGGLLYMLAGKLVFAATGIAPQTRTDVFAFQGQDPIALYANLIKPALTYLGETVLHRAYPRLVLGIAVLCVSAALCVQTVRVFVRKKYGADRIALVCLLTLLLPFAMISIYFLSRGNNVHDLMVYSVWFFYIFLVCLAYRFCDEDMLPGRQTSLLRAAACLLAFFVLWQNVVLANTAYVKKELEAEAALSRMTRVVTMLEQQDDYVYEETTVAFVGADNTVGTIPGMEKVRYITGLYSDNPIPCDSSHYYYNAYGAYFKYVLDYPINLCGDELHDRLKADPQVQDMPAFPSDGCMKMINGVLVIKMG